MASILKKVSKLLAPSQFDRELNPYSYRNILDDIQRFKKSGGKKSDEFNIYDIASHKYFKIFFYFVNGNSDDYLNALSESGGLLAPTWELPNVSAENYFIFPSAWAYLKLNNEYERALMLKRFVELLSNINTYSPWYFSTIENMEEVFDRKLLTDKDFKVPEERKKISIKCMPDAYDNRIQTLLELYRSIVYSWELKKEIVPANLRKFDMGIYIFESPIKNIHGKLNGSQYAGFSIYGDANEYLTSYQYLEFHNCEIDYNCIKSGFSSLNNIDGITPTYSIDIFYDDVYEMTHNEFETEFIHLGDAIFTDSVVFDYTNGLGIGNNGLYRINPMDGNFNYTDKYINYFEKSLFDQRSGSYESGFLTNALKEVIGGGMRFLKRISKKITLGNLYSFSLSKFGDQLRALSKGHVWSTVSSVKSYINNAKLKKSAKAKGEFGNIYGDNNNSLKNQKRIQQLGNIYSAKSKISNI